MIIIDAHRCSSMLIDAHRCSSMIIIDAHRCSSMEKTSIWKIWPTLIWKSPRVDLEITGRRFGNWITTISKLLGRFRNCWADFEIAGPISINHPGHAYGGARTYAQ